MRNYTTCMKFSNDFWKQQNDSVLQMVADGHGLSSTAPQLLSLPLASADARFSPNAPPHHQKPCGCLRAQTAARCSADGGAVQAGRDARGCVGAGGARALVHSSGASSDGSVRARCMLRAYASMCARMQNRHSLFACSARARQPRARPTPRRPPLLRRGPARRPDPTARPRRRAPPPRDAAEQLQRGG